MIPVSKSEQFEADFSANALYLSRKNPSSALRFVGAVERAIELLAAHPEIGPAWRYGSAERPTRFLLVPRFLGSSQ
jgi:plasmid stabilization system protein ParE